MARAAISAAYSLGYGVACAIAAAATRVRAPGADPRLHARDVEPRRRALGAGEAPTRGGWRGRRRPDAGVASSIRGCARSRRSVAAGAPAARAPRLVAEPADPTPSETAPAASRDAPSVTVAAADSHVGHRPRAPDAHAAPPGIARPAPASSQNTCAMSAIPQCRNTSGGLDPGGERRRRRDRGARSQATGTCALVGSKRVNEFLSWLLDSCRASIRSLRTLLAGLAIMLETSMLIGLIVPGDTIVIVAATAVVVAARGRVARGRRRDRRPHRREHRVLARTLARPPHPCLASRARASARRTGYERSAICVAGAAPRSSSRASCPCCTHSYR